MVKPLLAILAHGKLKSLDFDLYTSCLIEKGSGHKIWDGSETAPLGDQICQCPSLPSCRIDGEFSEKGGLNVCS